MDSEYLIGAGLMMAHCRFALENVVINNANVDVNDKCRNTDWYIGIK